MAYVYAVRCNFTRPAQEDAWNAWYNGPKLDSLLSMPMFLGGQRFVAAALLQRRRYLAIWLVESPDAFTTPEYKAAWGFAEWTPHITDWSRDLYRAPDGDPAARFGLQMDEALHLVSFEDLDEATARAERERIGPERPGMNWMEAVGLDRHSPLLGLARVAGDFRPAPLRAPAAVQETIFRPLFPFRRAT